MCGDPEKRNAEYRVDKLREQAFPRPEDPQFTVPTAPYPDADDRRLDNQCTELAPATMLCHQ